jgi:hypothetical protein
VALATRSASSAPSAALVTRSASSAPSVALVSSLIRGEARSPDPPWWLCVRG